MTEHQQTVAATPSYEIISKLIAEIGPDFVMGQFGDYYMDFGNLQWFAHEAHKRLKAAEEGPLR